MTLFTTTVSLTDSNSLAAGAPNAVPSRLPQRFSNIVVDQSLPVVDSVAADQFIYQEFAFPADYPRGTVEQLVPDLSGIQVYVGVAEGAAETASFEWTLEYYQPGYGWSPFLNGTSVGTATDGDETWFNICFDPQDVSQTWTLKWRFGIRGNEGIAHVWYSSSQPLNAYGEDGVNPLAEPAVSLIYRILGEVADSGRDLLGNEYRGVAFKSSVQNVSAKEDFNNWWMSKPNPSRFAVESLYFDLRKDGSPSVVDRLLVDPITPGVYFNLYYSQELDAGIDENSWDDLLWHPVPKTFKMTAREIQVLPKPIATNFMKMEFVHLQAQSYDPGPFQRPVVYKRFPSWVVAYYDAVFTWIKARNLLVSDSVTVIFDALSLAFNYYTADLTQNPDTVVLAGLNDAGATQLFSQSDLQVDITTLSKIVIDFQPFLSPPASKGRGTLLSDFAGNNLNTIDYSTEANVRPSFDTAGETGTEDLTQLLDELNQPPMNFFLPTRHHYRRVAASFDYHVGYFAGVRTVAFLRATNVTSGTQTYQDIVADDQAVFQSDLPIVITDDGESYLAPRTG